MHRALVVTASNRAAAGVYEDRGGPILHAGLTALGFAVDGPQVVPRRRAGGQRCATRSRPGTTSC